jgi:hypothetical protein
MTIPIDYIVQNTHTIHNIQNYSIYKEQGKYDQLSREKTKSYNDLMIELSKSLK